LLAAKDAMADTPGRNRTPGQIRRTGLKSN
jgi:hypothetical protein